MLIRSWISSGVLKVVEWIVVEEIVSDRKNSWINISWEMKNEKKLLERSVTWDTVHENLKTDELKTCDKVYFPTTAVA